MNKQFDSQKPGTLLPWLKLVLPFWLERTPDQRGGFYQELDADSNPVKSPGRTLYVQARMLSVASQAYQLTNGKFAWQVGHGFEFINRMRSPSKDEGWYHEICPNGQVVDTTFDLYDHAFLLCAMAEYYKASGESKAIRVAESTYGFLQTRLSDSQHGGFFEQLSPGSDAVKVPRRHNPHMNILEALLSLFLATKNQFWLDEARKITALLQAKFIHRQTRALVEFFGADWSQDYPGDTSAPDQQLAARQPGHHFEWGRLLRAAAALLDKPELIYVSDSLYDFACVNGIEKQYLLNGTAFDGLDPDGRLSHNTRSLWQSLELVGLHAAQQNSQSKAATQTLLGSIQNGFMRTNGLTWYPQIDYSMVPTSQNSPARLLYHLVPRFLEAACMFGL